MRQNSGVPCSIRQCGKNAVHFETHRGKRRGEREVETERWELRGGTREVGPERWEQRDQKREVGTERWEQRSEQRGGNRKVGAEFWEQNTNDMRYSTSDCRTVNGEDFGFQQKMTSIFLINIPNIPTDIMSTLNVSKSYVQV